MEASSAQVPAGASRSFNSSNLLGGKPNTPWSILVNLYNNRDKFSDVEIKCLDGKKLNAHKAILAARERFFAEIFFPQAQQQAHPRARRAAKATFPEESNVLQSIIEYLYTGVIEELETAPSVFPDQQGRLWIKTIMWCSRHDIKSVFDYVHVAILGRIFTPACAAELLALVAHSVGAAAQTGNTPSEQLRARQIDELKELAVSSFVKADFTDQIFAPLSRVALKVLLQSNALRVKEVQVVQAVQWWSKESAWVRNNVESGVLTADNMTDITGLLHPCNLSGQEFGKYADLFPKSAHAEIWRNIVLIQTNRVTPALSRELMPVGPRPDLPGLARERHASSLLDLENFAVAAHDRHSSVLSSALRSNRLSYGSGADMPAVGGRSESIMGITAVMAQHHIHDERYSEPAPPQHAALAPAAAPLPVQNQFRQVGMFEPEATGNVAPTAPTVNDGLNAGQVRATMELAARSDPNDPLSSFHFGSGMQIQEVEPYVTLVSSDTTHHQSMLYKVGITTGSLRWSLEVVRPCDMLWMGVSAEFGLDTSQWAARHPGVWMASEESSCLAHIAEYTALTLNNQPAQPMHPAHVGLTRLPCVRCIYMDPDQDDDTWSVVTAELRIENDLGELWMDVNKTGMQKVFHSLPTDKPLYPVVSVINAMQVKFTHLE